MPSKINKISFYWSIVKAAFSRFFEKNLLNQSAALSFYTIFSLPPMLLIILKILTQVFQEQEIKQSVFTEIGDLVGSEGAEQLMNTIDKLNIFEPTWWATAVGIGFLIITSTTVFITMQNGLNSIFEVKANQLRGSGLLKMVRDRIVSLGLLISMAFILLVSLMVDALLTWFSNYIAQWFGELSAILFFLASILMPLGVTTLLFAMLFRFLPDAKLRWKDTWVGAIVTAILFALGKYMIGFYIGKSSAASLYDAAGSVLVLMLWVYYASAILLFGATFTYIRAKSLRGIVQPADYAVRVELREVEMDQDADSP